MATVKKAQKGKPFFVRFSDEAHDWLFTKAGPGKPLTATAELERLILADKRKVMAMRDYRKAKKAPAA